MVVEYVPEDSVLTPVVNNIQFYERPIETLRTVLGDPMYSSQDEVPFETSLEWSISRQAPISAWRGQRLLLDNLDKINIEPLLY
jgi:hypothetical protein